MMFPVCSQSVPSFVPGLSSLLSCVFPVFLVYVCRAYMREALTHTHRSYENGGEHWELGTDWSQ
jgi:hypothetical protein